LQGRPIQETVRAFVRSQQHVQPPAQGGITSAVFVQEGGALVGQ
jgi:hypothetical protein